MMILPEPLRKVGDKVFDMASQQIVTILEVTVEEDDYDDEQDDLRGHIYYRVDAPPDPTGDGAFTDGYWNYYEVCDPNKTLPLEY
jgi:hypothetical protein